jgi:uncharacterized protein YhbP (UPF0306 family)
MEQSGKTSRHCCTKQGKTHIQAHPNDRQYVIFLCTCTYRARCCTEFLHTYDNKASIAALFNLTEQKTASAKAHNAQPHCPAVMQAVRQLPAPP